MGTGPPRLEKLRSLRDVNARDETAGGGWTQGPDGGSQGQAVRFSLAGTWPSNGSGTSESGSETGEESKRRGEEGVGKGSGC